MIVIPPQDPDERRSDPAEEALGSLYDEITKAQDVGNFYGALVKRQELFKARQQNLEDNFDQYQNLHPRDFYRQFHRQADGDDKAIISEAPYSVRQRLKDSLFDYRQPAFERASRTYKLLFVNHQLIRLAQDKEFLLNQAADALSDQERDLWLGALAGRIQESGDKGILHKGDADAAVANIPGEYDAAVFTRDFNFGPAGAGQLLRDGGYANIPPERRYELLKLAGAATTQLSERGSSAGSFPPTGDSIAMDNSETNKDAGEASNEQDAFGPESQVEETDGEYVSDSQAAGNHYAAAAGQGGGRPGAGKQPPTIPIQKFTQPITDWRGRKVSAEDLNRATAVVYGEMTGSDLINSTKTFPRTDKATGSNFDTTMTKLGQVGEAYGLASILWNRLEKPGEYHSSGQPQPKDLKGIIESKDQFVSVGDWRYNEAMQGRVSDLQAYALAREAVERTARFGPSFNFDSNRAALPNASAANGVELRQGWVNMGSGTDFGRIIKP